MDGPPPIRPPLPVSGMGFPPPPPGPSPGPPPSHSPFGMRPPVPVGPRGVSLPVAPSPVPPPSSISANSIPFGVVSEQERPSSTNTPFRERDTPSYDENREKRSKSEARIPSVLEKALSMKAERAQELGYDLERAEKTNSFAQIPDEKIDSGVPTSTEEAEASPDETSVVSAKEIFKKNQKKKLKKRNAKLRRRNQPLETQFFVTRFIKDDDDKAEDGDEKRDGEAAATRSDEPVEIEYVPEELKLDQSDPLYAHFNQIFENFKLAENLEEMSETKKSEVQFKKEFQSQIDSINEQLLAPKAKHALLMEKESAAEAARQLADEDDEDNEKKVSRKKWKRLTRLSVAQLKQLVERPDLVDFHDVNARDPKLLLHLKATRNTVPVPRHWCYKRKYLSGKRGYVKPPFKLPDFIRMTGIQEMRDSRAEQEEGKTLKAKMRERVRPKLGKIEIDYQKLHDAFFKYQTKPRMSRHGDIYYEGKEHEIEMRDKQPGTISDELRVALGMPVGANKERYPPPWLIAQQRYGPAPAYPNLKVAGLNAPIPRGCSFGYHSGGWGKPPVDEYGRPLYGDVFGDQSAAQQTGGPVIPELSGPIEEQPKGMWGEFEEVSESEADEEEVDDDASTADARGDGDMSGVQTPASGMVTPSGLTSVGTETPGLASSGIEIRKHGTSSAALDDTSVSGAGGDTPAGTPAPGTLYSILPEKRTSVGNALIGNVHGYDIGGAQGVSGVEISLEPTDLDLEPDKLREKYEAARGGPSNYGSHNTGYEEFAAEHAKKRKRQDAGKQSGQASSGQSGKASTDKKYKQFKF